MAATHSDRASYRQLPGVSPDQERTALAGALRHLMHCHEKKQAAAAIGGEEARKEDYASRADTSISE